MSKGRLVEKSYYFRPVSRADVDDLTAMVKLSSGGLSSLQPRREFMYDYVRTSEKSFSGTMELETPHKYLMGLFDDDKLIGCSAVKTEIGVDSPFINFDIVGEGLDQYLVASTRFMGASEVGSLFLQPEYRKDGLGRYLAKVRYMLMASEPWRFGETIVAELRGLCGENGSPLFDFLFKDKLEMSFLEADKEYFDRNPKSLGDIVPIGKIPLEDFPIDVRASIGQPHPSGIGAMRLLQKEGFIFSGTIDLFDAGPIVHAYRDTIRTIRNRQRVAITETHKDLNGETVLMCAGRVKDFRACVGPARVTQSGTIHLKAKDADWLRVTEGETLDIWTEAGEKDLLTATNATKLLPRDAAA